jgi:hypothetical protein
MTSSTSAQSKLLSALSRVVDEPLRAEGFGRQARNFVFSRKLNASRQEIAFAADWHPRYQARAEAHLHPMFRIKMPTISKLALELVKGDKMLLAGASDVILNEPIEFAAPKIDHARWFATGAEEFVEACQSILAFLRQWVLPLLSEVSTPGDLVRVYEAKDARIIKQKHWHIYVLAAYMELGRTNEARQLLREQFGSPGLRGRYACLFETIDLSTRSNATP